MSSDFFDKFFKVLLLLACLIVVALFARSLFSENYLQGCISIAGLCGIFFVYMRWRIIELVLMMGKQDPDSLDSKFVENALNLIPRQRGEMKSE